MNIAPLFSDPLARQLYAEIASAEEQHVTHYASLRRDPAEIVTGLTYGDVEADDDGGRVNLPGVARRSRSAHNCSPAAWIAYNVGMTQISLVLPFALPPPELAPDLVRALNAPALASLLTRGSIAPAHASGAGRALPHEHWLAQSLGLGGSAFAAQAMRGFGLDPAGGTWFIVHPAHVEIARSHMLMSDLRGLGLTDAHARALFDLAKPYFDEAGKPLLYGDAHTWFMRADDWAGLDTATPDAAAGMNLTDWLPAGEKSKDYRKLQNEVQMLWHQHPVNVEREASGQQAINAFWPWAPATATATGAPGTSLATSNAPGWLAALGDKRHLAVDALLAAEDTVLVEDSLSRAAIATEWSAWLAQVQHLDTALFAPLLAAVRDGRLARLRLVLSHRDRCIEFTTNKLAQRMFWRRPTLDRLLP